MVVAIDLMMMTTMMTMRAGGKEMDCYLRLTGALRGIVTKTTQHCQLAKRTIIEHQFTIITVALYVVYSL